jgi:hypothetical protein
VILLGETHLSWATLRVHSVGVTWHLPASVCHHVDGLSTGGRSLRKDGVTAARIQICRDSDWLHAGRLMSQSSSPGWIKNFLFYSSSRPALGSTQLIIQCVLGALSLGVKRPGCEADHSLTVPRSRKRGSIHPLPHTSSCRSA